MLGFFLMVCGTCLIGLFVGSYIEWVKHRYFCDCFSCTQWRLMNGRHKKADLFKGTYVRRKERNKL